MVQFEPLTINIGLIKEGDIMDKNNIYEVIEKILNTIHLPGEWSLVWYEQKKYVELTVQLEFDNPEEVGLIDEVGEQMRQERNLYQLHVIFYDNKYYDGGFPHCLVSIGINPDEGVEYSYLYAVLDYLKYLLVKSRLEWNEFIYNDRSTFDIEWKKEELNARIEHLKTTHRYSTKPLFFPHQLN